MSRPRKFDKYQDSSSFSSGSSLDTIRNICNDISPRSSSKSNSNAINTIREVCNDFNIQVETNTDPSSINAIREICNDFAVHSESRNSPSTINAIREICDGFTFQTQTRTSSSAIDAMRRVDLRNPKVFSEPRTSSSAIDAMKPIHHRIPKVESEPRTSSSPIDAMKHVDYRNSKVDTESLSPDNCPPQKHKQRDCPPRRHKQKDCNIYDGSTMDDLKNICGDYKISRPMYSREIFCPPNQDNCYRPCERYDPGNSYFNSVITPVSGLIPQYSGVTGTVQFRMRRKNKTVTLQWEPFSGTIAASGIAFLTVMQSIWNTPPYPMSWPITILYKDVNQMTNITIDPSSTTGNIRFYLNTDGTATGITIGDAFYVYSSSISWIVD